MSVDLARELAEVAQDLEDRGYWQVGTLRRAARALLEVPDRDEGCRGCGAQLVYAGTGRPRSWCSETCRRRHRP